VLWTKPFHMGRVGGTWRCTLRAVIEVKKEIPVLMLHDWVKSQLVFHPAGA
jgi:hypothetical protein